MEDMFREYWIRCSIDNCLYCIEFKLGPTATEATTNVNMAWGEGAASERTVRRWFQKFGNETICLEDKERAGRPSLVDPEVLIESS
ncbi:hypothetical protein OSTOST_17488 [Ostertagia ostertagi]